MESSTNCHDQLLGKPSNINNAKSHIKYQNLHIACSLGNLNPIEIMSIIFPTLSLQYAFLMREKNTGEDEDKNRAQTIASTLLLVMSATVETYNYKHDVIL